MVYILTDNGVRQLMATLTQQKVLQMAVIWQFALKRRVRMWTMQ